MKKVASFSWGRTSAYLVIYLMEKFGPENVDVISMDTGAEHEGTYEFARKFDEYLNKTYGKKIVYLRTNFDTPLGAGNGYKVVGLDGVGQDLKPFSDMMKKYGVPYIGGMFCTDRMKLVPFKKYCDDKYGKKNYETWLGIRYDEPMRVVGEDLYRSLRKKMGFDDETILEIARAKPDERESYFLIGESFEKEIYTALQSRLSNGIRYLAEVSDFEKTDILNYWDEMPFDLEINEYNGNCVFCPKKSDLKIVAAKRDNPTFYHEFLCMLYSDSVREDEKTGQWHGMYRKQRSLEQVIAMFDGVTTKEIKERIRGEKVMDSGSCSESCEVFS